MNPRILLAGLALIAAVVTVVVVATAGSDDGETLTAADSAVRPTVAPTTEPPVASSTAPPTTATTEPPATSRPPATTGTTQPRAGSTPTTATAPPPSTLPGIEPNGPPAVSITSPGALSRHAAAYDGATGTFRAVVSFSAAVTDPEGDAFTVQWFSSMGGFLGEGLSVTAVLRPDGDASQPVITAVATDVTGAQGSASTQVIVWIPSDQ